MNCAHLVLLILFSNSVLFSMENESQKTVICHRDVNGQSWRVDKEIQFINKKHSAFPKMMYKNYINSVNFDATDTKIIAIPLGDNDIAYMWDRSGKGLDCLDKHAWETFCKNNDAWADRLYNSGNHPGYHRYENDLWELLRKRFGTCTMQCFNEGQAFVVPLFRICVIDGGDKVYAWDSKENKILFSLEHQDTVQSVDFNPQGIEIITASSDGTVRLWNKKDGKELLCIKYPTRVTSASFNSTGTEMVVGTDDGKIQILVKETS